tara:strand:- start:13214 stop:14173 length:960 start_codon:yes stop_codon:yes gene_type:complete
MNVALIVAGRQSIQSFWCHDGKPYTGGRPYNAYKGTTTYYEYGPYNGIRNIYNVPRPFEEGWFIGWEYNRDLVDRNFDVIFLVIEPPHHKKYSVSTIRERYPNAKIIGYFKEKNPVWSMPQSRRDFLSECDCVATPYKNKLTIKDKKVFKFQYPYPFSDFQHIIKGDDQKIHDIFLGGNWWNGKRGYGETKEFVEKLSDRHGYTVLNYRREYGSDLGWKHWLEMLSRCRICINLDPKPEIGQEAIECAALGVTHLGSNLDAHKRLFRTITCLDELEEQAIRLFEDKDFYYSENKSAFDKFLEIYSFESARKNLEAILSE